MSSNVVVEGIKKNLFRGNPNENLPDEDQGTAKSTVNAQAAVSLLPFELLSHIFALVQELHTLHAEDGATFLESKWLRVTQVCHVWRTAALRSPLLWSNISMSCRSVDHVSEMLVRSRDTPITAYVDLDQYPSDSNTSYRPSQQPYRDALGVLLTQWTRIQELTIRRAHLPALRALFKSVPCIIPQVRVLRINVAPSSFDQFYVSDATLQLPALRRLSISACILNLNSTFLLGLTHLHIRHRQTISLPTFLFALSQMKALQSLDFEHYSYGSAVSASLDRVELPSLKYLQIRAAVGLVAALFNGIRVKCGLHLYFYAANPAFNNSMSDFDPLTQSLCPLLTPANNDLASPLLSPNSAKQWKAYRIYKSSFWQISIQAYTETLSHEEVLMPCRNPVSEWTLSWSRRRGLQEEEADDRIFRQLFNASPMESLSLTQFVGGLALSTETWSQTLGSLPHLSSIMVGEKIATFFESLVEGSESSPPPFPALATIVVHRVQLHTLEDCILKSLQARKELGVPVRELIFADCPVIPPRPIHQLESVVEKVGFWFGTLDFDAPLERSTRFDIDIEVIDDF